MQGKDKEAVPLIEQAVSGTLEADARAEYLAPLFLGAIQVRAKQFDRAEASFRAASARVPEAQSANIALASALYARGDAIQSADVLGTMVRGADQSTDAWWGYRFGQYWAIDPLLTTLRKGIVK